MKRNRLLTSTLCGLLLSIGATAQQLPPVTLDIGVANGVLYLPDTSDYTKFGTMPGPVMPTPTANGLGLPNFITYVEISDVVSVNGEPAKGTFVNQGRFLQLSSTPKPGQAVSDSGWYAVGSQEIDLLTADGTRIGTLSLAGLALGAPPPGAPAGYSSAAIAVHGGTGAFAAARGQALLGNVGARFASITEDPANRRSLGGQPPPEVRHLLVQVIPAVRPEIEAVYHLDFSPVTPDKPAQKGETLITLSRGLGPTHPGVAPGQPFPALEQGTQTVNAPVGVTVDGKSTNISNALGWPGLVDGYRVDFQVPNDTASGAATVQLTAAWIPGNSTTIPVQ